MWRATITCWKCGHKYEEDIGMINQICPKCGVRADDGKKSVRVGKWIMAIGIITAILSLWVVPIMFNTDPSIPFLFIGILVAVLGFFVQVFAKLP